jgi:hypothetical protein
MSALDHFRDDLIQDIDDALNLIRIIITISSITTLPTNLSSKHRETIVEWAFVNLHTEWENFLENCFITYMLGGHTDSGYSPVRYIFPKDEQHAMGIILAGRDFFQWTKPIRVKEQSVLCFENGEPFRSVLESTMTELNEMTNIRNAIVHKSATAMEKFRGLVRNKLKTLPLAMTPGVFLVTTKPKTLSATFLSGYCRKLKIISGKLVP